MSGLHVILHIDNILTEGDGSIIVFYAHTELMMMIDGWTDHQSGQIYKQVLTGDVNLMVV